MAKKVKKTQKKVLASVQVVGDGSNKVLLVFPRGSRIKAKGKLSAAKVLKLLKGSGQPAVSGQCWPEINCDCPGYCSCLRIAPAVAGVRG